MNKELKQLWIEALLSGDFIQGKETLKQRKLDYRPMREGETDTYVTSHCCLGVLCEVAVKNNMVPDGVGRIKIENDSITNGFNSRNVLDSPVMWGINIKDHNHLTEMNDNDYSFLDIADYIRENL